MVTVFPVSIVKQGVVLIHVPLQQKPSHIVSDVLKNRCSPGVLPEAKLAGTELAVLAHCLVEVIQRKWQASLKLDLTAKMPEFSYDIQGKDMIIRAVSASTFSAVRKIISVSTLLIVQMATKYKTIYKKYLGILGLKMDDEAFAGALATFVAGCKAAKFSVVGPLIADDKTKKMTEVIQAKLGEMAVVPAKYPQGAKEPDPTPSLKGSKFECLIVESYMAAYNQGVRVVDSAVVPDSEKRWESIMTNLKSKDKKPFVAKFMKLGDKLGAALLMRAAKSGYFTPADLATLPKAPTEAQLSAVLKRHFG